ncbi:hypothetical protein [Pseudarthrobacter sp. NS4]|uniref:hypothetical protein n=1 Tax=Pseudarthrobacter sp. NS4 TaxID=2973976 RepID=UPI0021627125|nr:hypothetical protein [Pseudarthrobacter sp. NS4]
MSNDPSGKQQRDNGPHLHAHAAPTTQQIRTVGQRRREAEEKLEHHLAEARHKSESDRAAGLDAGSAKTGPGNAGPVPPEEDNDIPAAGGPADRADDG